MPYREIPNYCAVSLVSLLQYETTKEVERIPERCPCPKCSAMPWPLGGSRAIRHRGLGSSAISEQPFSRSGFRNMCSSFRAKFGTVDQRSLRGTVGSTSTLENLQLQGTWQWQHRGKAWGAKPGSEARQGPCALFRVAGLWGASKGRHRSICTALWDEGSGHELLQLLDVCHPSQARSGAWMSL